MHSHVRLIRDPSRGFSKIRYQTAKYGLTRNTPYTSNYLSDNPKVSPQSSNKAPDAHFLQVGGAGLPSQVQIPLLGGLDLDDLDTLFKKLAKGKAHVQKPEKIARGLRSAI